MATGLKNPPYSQPLADSQGLLSGVWRAFFRDLVVRIGGENALSNVELQALPALNLTAITARVTTAESEIASLQSTTTSHTTTLASIAVQIQGLGVGRQL